jgi:hypothetical protein
MRASSAAAFNVSRARMVSTLALVSIFSGCSSSTEPRSDWARVTLISGANQTVTVNSSGLTDLPELVVVRIDSLGTPIAGAEIRVSVQMNGAPGPNGPYSFFAGSDGIASMQLQVSNIRGPVAIDVEYIKCAHLGFFACDRYATLASTSVPGTIAQ